MCTHNRHNIIVFNAHHIQRWWPFMHAFTATHFHTLFNSIFMRNVPTVWIVCLCISSRMMCPIERFHQTTRVLIKCSSLHQFFCFFLICHFLSSFTHNVAIVPFLVFKIPEHSIILWKPKAQMCDDLSIKSILGIDTKSTFEFIEALDISSIARHVMFRVPLDEI